MLSAARTIVRKMNDLFISAVLVVFYFFVVGITALLLLAVTKIKGKKNRSSYWKNADGKKFTADYFKSPY